MARYAKFFSVGATGGGGGSSNSLQLPSGTILDATLRQVQDGTGTGSPLYLSTGSVRIGTTAGSAMYWDNTNNRLGIGTNAPSATTHIKGVGTTSSTTSLLVQNSAGNTALTVKDDLSTTFGGSVGVLGYSLSLSGGITFIDSGQFYRSGNIALQCVSGVGNNNSVLINDNPNSTLANSAILVASSTTKGFLPPRMTEAQVLAIASPAIGLMAYNTDKDCPVFYSAAGWRKVSHSAM